MGDVIQLNDHRPKHPDHVRKAIQSYEAKLIKHGYPQNVVYIKLIKFIKAIKGEKDEKETKDT